MIYLNWKFTSTSDLSFAAALVIVVVISALLVVNRRYIMQSHRETYEEIEKEISTIGQVIDIQKNAQFDPVVMGVVTSYTHIAETDLIVFKNNIMEEAREKLRQLEEDKCTNLLEPKEGFDLSGRKLEQLKSGDTVRAISFLGKVST